MKALSVIVTTYNSASTVEACLQAIRNSFFTDYELIVLDDGSTDTTAALSEKYADRIIRKEKNEGIQSSRLSAFEAAQSEIIVNVDSDVLVDRCTLGLIFDVFQENPEIIGLTGMLAKEHPHANFSSQYKNLYMHYIFSLLPSEINFLYGSVFAVKKESFNSSDFVKACPNYGDDTFLGLRLSLRGGVLLFRREIEVVHLKKFSLFGLMQNDFLIPYGWAHIFILDQGWKELGKDNGGFFHSPRKQLASIILAFVVILVSFSSVFFSNLALEFLIITGYGGWLLLNYDFLKFLTKERGVCFLLQALIITFVDNVVMASGVVCGIAVALIKKLLFRK